MLIKAPSQIRALCGGILMVATLSSAFATQVSVHDPVMAKEGDTYYVFSTDPGVKFYASKDMKTWKLADRVFKQDPTWAARVAPGFNGHIWAPDIIQHDGKFYLYYSVSAFGKNTSGIGVTVNKTLNPASPDYKWEDQGMVIQSIPGRDLWNAIDPNVVVDENGTPWMSFGSWWGGLKLVKLDSTLTRLAEPQEWYTIARRDRPPFVDDRSGSPAAIEAPFIYKKGDFYYLFASWDRCCAGKDSTYKMVVGRAKDVRGPYLDKTGKEMAKGGGTLLLAGNEKWPGVGHNGVYNFDGKDIIVFHAYETADRGLQKLKIAELLWDQNGWPFIDPSILDTYQSELVQ
ncbi:MAG: arabinan endo-1,5-alpha-L-arabinosidase [Nibricoccus sp.]